MQEIMWGINSILFLITIILLIIWEGIWKGIGLWKSAKKGHIVWFVCIFVLNTLGILPILYIYVFSKKRVEKKVSKKRR